MGEEVQALTALSSPFPPPPSFYKSFTAENISALQSHLDSTTPGLSSYNPLYPTSGPIPSPTALSSDIESLLPPPLPLSGAYRAFNELHLLQPPRDIPTPPTQSHLLALLRQILLKFLEITHILSLDPSVKYYAPAWEELQGLFREMYEGLNQWRPHQGREALISMMEEQIKGVREETEWARRAVGKAREVVEEIARGGMWKEGVDELDGIGIDGEPLGIPKVNNRAGRRKLKEKKIWEVIEREVKHVDDDI